MANTGKAFLGAGLRFPLQTGADGELALSSEDDKVREAILLILGTQLGERVMRPDFGCGLRSLVFEPVGATTAALVRHRVAEALTLWEPRIDQVQLTVEAVPRQGLLSIALRYRVRATNTFYNLVYPFYLTEGREVCRRRAGPAGRCCRSMRGSCTASPSGWTRRRSGCRWRCWTCWAWAC
jgi:phage baseplate assembly protein W